MRSLGYYDGYLGFLAQPGQRPKPNTHLIDVGAGTAAFSEAWVAVNGAPSDLLLLDTSQAMLERGAAAIAQHGIKPRTAQCALENAAAHGPADEVLAAHLIEHIPDADMAMDGLRNLTVPGGKLRLVVSKPHWCNAIVWLKWRHRSFTPEAMRALLARHGLKLEAEYAFPQGPPSRTSRGYVARRQ